MLVHLSMGYQDRGIYIEPFKLKISENLNGAVVFLIK